MAATCDFANITNPLDEALRTHFICSIKNEAVLKALFKCKNEDLTFARAVEIATETEEAAKVAEETAVGPSKSPISLPINKLGQHQSESKSSAPRQNKSQTESTACRSCGKSTHERKNCRFKGAECNFCGKNGHIEAVCFKKKAESRKTVKPIFIYGQTKALRQVNQTNVDDEITQNLQINGRSIRFELDTGAPTNFITRTLWQSLGKPHLQSSDLQFDTASKHQLPILGKVELPVKAPTTCCKIWFHVTSVLGLNLIGRSGIRLLDLSVDEKIKKSSKNTVAKVFEHLKPDTDLQQRCRVLCSEFPDLFKPELGCLKDFELEIKVKPDYKPIFCRPRPVPFAIQEDLVDAYEAGIKHGVWKRTEFNDEGTPVVPIQKTALPGQTKRKIRIFGDYSVSINTQLEPHRYPMPLPEDLLRKLRGGYGCTKIDLADAYNQIRLCPISQKRLALSTHTGVLLQLRLPFGITSAPGYFQETMDKLTSDLPGVAVYLDDILVSGNNAADYISNLRGLLQRLSKNGLRCRLEKCIFASSSIEYLGHTLSSEGIAKGNKVDAVLAMPVPKDVNILRSFLGQVQFYGKFLPPNLSMTLDPLYRLIKKDVPWQ